MSEQAGGKAQIDFLCVEDGCGGVVKFDLMSLAQEDFQVWRGIRLLQYLGLALC